MYNRIPADRLSNTMCIRGGVFPRRIPIVIPAGAAIANTVMIQKRILKLCGKALLIAIESEILPENL